MSNFKAMKFHVTSAEHCKKLQDALFALGYKWHHAGQTHCGLDRSRWLFTYEDGDITYTHDDCYGVEHVFPEYVLTPEGTFMLASGYFKQPATTPTFKDRLTAAVARKKKDIESAFVAKYLPHDVEWKIPLFTVATDEPAPLLSREEHERQRILILLDAAMDELKAKRNIPQEWIDEVRDLWDNQQSRLVEEF